MASLKLSISKQAEANLRRKIAEQVGKKARRVMLSLHTQILEGTAFNTGRTLGSWYGSADRPFLIDIADRFGPTQFAYSTALPATNQLEIGAEPGRGFYERLSLSTTQSIKFEADPYRKFYLANGARLDSGFGLEKPLGPYDSLSSSLPQGPGSRAAAQEYGYIAHFDLFNSAEGAKTFSFQPRGMSAFLIAVEKVRRDANRL